MAIISLIAAMSSNRTIGKDNQLPWSMPTDMAYFRDTTRNKIVVMGRKTYAALGKALPHRRNIVLTSQQDLILKDAEVYHSVEKILSELSTLSNETEVFIIGGAEIYQQFMPYSDRIYITYINAIIEGDTFFPPWDTSRWHETWRENHEKDTLNPYDYSFVILEKT